MIDDNILACELSAITSIHTKGWILLIWHSIGCNIAPWICSDVVLHTCISIKTLPNRLLSIQIVPLMCENRVEPIDIHVRAIATFSLLILLTPCATSSVTSQ